MSEWVSVKDRLPEGLCLAVHKRGDMLIGYVAYDTDMEWYECELDGVYLPNVTHWMPLPEPPKEEKE